MLLEKNRGSNSLWALFLHTGTVRTLNCTFSLGRTVTVSKGALLNARTRTITRLSSRKMSLFKVFKVIL